MKKLLLTAAVALVCAGCATQTRSVTKDGVTTTTKTRMFLETIQGFDDKAVAADGSILYSTTIQNLTGDVQMVLAIDQLVQNVAKAALLASGNTNFNGTNLFTITPRFALKRPAH
jgi:hypothetical protein